MMNRPSSAELTKNGESYYSLVVGVAKRARQIAEEVEANGRELLEKPVQVAVDELKSGKYHLVEHMEDDFQPDHPFED